MQSLDVDSIKETVNELEEKLLKIPLLAKLHAQVKVPLVYLFAGALVGIAFFIYIISGLRAIATLVGFVYPAYQSLVALSTGDKEDDKLWLAYWVWYGLFTVVESITDVLFFWMGSLYELSKIAFFVYLYAPNVQGAIFLYDKILAPYVLRSVQVTDKIKAEAEGVKSVFDRAAAKATAGEKDLSKKAA